MGQTVNLLSYDFGGSNPPLPTINLGIAKCRIRNTIRDPLISGSSSFGRALAFQAGGGGFEPRLPLSRLHQANVSQSVEHIHGKDEVISSILIIGSAGERGTRDKGQGRGKKKLAIISPSIINIKTNITNNFKINHNGKRKI